MTVRHATENDISSMMSLFEDAKGIMRADGNMSQWTGGYPQEAVALRDVRASHAFIVEDGGVPVGTFAFIPGSEPTYRTIYEGAWLDADAPYATIHRLASTPQSHGVARACFDWCASRCPNLRIDTHRDTSIMRHVITSGGFRYCGIIYLANGDERLAYQWLAASL